MEKSRIVEILRTFSKVELKEFEKFIASPFFQRARSVTKFYGVLKKNYPDFSQKHVNKYSLFAKLYPGVEYKDHIMRNLSSTLLRLIEDYLTIKNFYKDPVVVKRHLLTELIDRNIASMNDNDINKFESYLSENRHSIENFFFEKYMLENLKILFKVQRNKQHLISENIATTAKLNVIDFLKRASVSVPNLQSVADSFNHDYSRNLLKGFFSSMDLKDFLGQLDTFELEPQLKIVAKIYCSIIITINEPTDEHYYSLFSDLLLNNLDYFDRFEKYNLLVTLSSCTSNKAAFISREKYLPKLFEIYKLRLELNLYNFAVNQNMSIIFFFSLLKLGLTLNQTDWVDHFVSKNISKLSVDQQVNMKHFAMASILFSKKHFTRSLEELSKVHFVTPSFKYEMRNLQLQLYYELHEFESALYALDSYRHFLNSNPSISGYFRVTLEEFFDLYRQLLRYRMNNVSDPPDSFYRKINNSVISQKNWLLEKFTQLKNSSEK
ncbi:MAG: hypothetical protein UZ04_CHB001002159 [Chlorobi bacterium OLB4]|jgi:hypothetical protein|nr:MAG: hypothetical protein UZ04_CHB001002159 [Chlorobi bacterium OLB4]MBW7856657.1 hypothetical protein [Ignavibacteria bacterium]OQY77180.1 MAG: hypothetical protein B6D43_07590 [Ignavibacteriales bacterium UTCHB1]